MSATEPSILRRAAALRAVAAAILLLCGCGGARTPAAEEIAPQLTNRAAFNRFVEQGWDSPFGLDYRCQLENDRRVLVAFYDDHIGQNHDEPMGEIETRIPVPASEVQITEIISRIDQTKPNVRSARVENGRLTCRLTEYPVFIELKSSE